jgi:surface protein
MFLGATAFNQFIGNWNVSNVEYMYSMFQGATAFNQPIGSWNMSSDTDTDTMFAGAAAFNQPIGGWNVTDVNYMYNMFQNATAFNQDISDWNVSAVYDMTCMFNGSALSIYNYDALLIAWSHLTLQTGVLLEAGSVQYDSTAAAARASIISIYGWTIHDGGLATVVPNMPTGLAATAGKDFVTLTWVAPVDNGGSAITGYKIYMGTSKGAETLLATIGNDTFYNATGLATGKTYYFFVCAVNSVGTGLQSNETSAAVPASSPPTHPPAPGFPVDLTLCVLAAACIGLVAKIKRKGIP